MSIQQMLKHHGFYREKKKTSLWNRAAVKAFIPWLSWTFRLVNKIYTAISYMYFYTKNEEK